MKFPAITFDSGITPYWQGYWRWLVRAACLQYRDFHVWHNPLTISFSDKPHSEGVLAATSPVKITCRAENKPGMLGSLYANELVHELSHWLLFHYFKDKEPAWCHKLDWNLTHFAVYLDPKYTYKRKYSHIKLVGWPETTVTYLDLPALIRDREQIMASCPPYDGRRWV